LGGMLTDGDDSSHTLVSTDKGCLGVKRPVIKTGMKVYGTEISNHYHSKDD
jgi:hypothetical protein